jgi:hypothetical protein
LGEIHVEIATADTTAGFERQDRMGLPGSGYGGFPLPVDKLVKLSSWGGGRGEQHVIGEVGRSVAGVQVRLDDDSQVDAQIVRTDVVDNDYFLVFVAEGREPVAVRALDSDRRELAAEERSSESIRLSQEFRRRHWPGR